MQKFQKVKPACRQTGSKFQNGRIGGKIRVKIPKFQIPNSKAGTAGVFWNLEFLYLEFDSVGIWNFLIWNFLISNFTRTYASFIRINY